LAELWEEWGALAYAAVFLWAFLEGETFVLAAAAVGAVAGGIDPWLLMFSAWFGSFCGDQCWFLLGRRYGPRMLERMPRAKAQFDKASVLLHRHGNAFVLSFRFLYGIRNVAAAACGMAGMPYARFATLNFIGAGVWASSFVAAGWFLGGWMGADNLAYAIAGIALSLLAFMVGRHLLRRRRRHRLASARGAA
jgi:membrane protein DedA with SNARE-associated domain